MEGSVNCLKRWLGLHVHEWQNAGNIMTTEGVYHVQVCPACGGIRYLGGWQRGDDL